MKMITRCPVCGTAFRVHQEQLEARRGQVRCGKCMTVFDANSALFIERQPEPPPPAQAELEPETSAVESDVEYPEPIAQTTPTVFEPASGSESESESESASALEPELGPEPEPEPEPAAERVPEPPPQRLAAEPTIVAAVDSVAPTTERLSQDDPALVPLRASPLAPRVDEPEQDFDFGIVDEPRSRKATLLMRAAATILVLTLVGQLIHAFRGDIAGSMPSTRPLLEALCRSLGCEVPLPRSADLVSIESSDLQFDRNAANVLTLSVVLRNRASFAQAYPAIELTLTNDQDRAVARRVLRPQDYAADRLQREPVFAPGSELAAKLHIDASGLGASGYRLFVFYL